MLKQVAKVAADVKAVPAAFGRLSVETAIEKAKQDRELSSRLRAAEC